MDKRKEHIKELKQLKKKDKRIEIKAKKIKGKEQDKLLVNRIEELKRTI